MRFVGHYALHVVDDTGVELRFDNQRPITLEARPWMHVIDIFRVGLLPVHHVEVFQDDNGVLIEETNILSIQTGPGFTEDGLLYSMRIIHPKPHGRGWALHYSRSDKRQEFRRPAPDPSTQRRLTHEQFRREYHNRVVQ